MRYLINGQVIYDSVCRTLNLDNESITLPVATSRLLEFFINNNHQPLNRSFILEEVWEKYGKISSGHSLNKSVSIIRKAFSEFGQDNPIETLPREGFLFYANLGNPDDSAQKDEEHVLAVIEKKRPGRNKNTIFFCAAMVILLIALGALVLSMILKENDSVVYVKTVGECEVYTTDDNAETKVQDFLTSSHWEKFSERCRGQERVIVFYDDNKLSAGNKLKEVFISFCGIDKKGAAHECENYIF